MRESKKYEMDYHHVKVINDLVYNEPTHTVSVFKDFLIHDDINEFLKRPYAFFEQRTRLPRLHAFYERELMEHQSYPGDKNPRPFAPPNYAALVPEPGQHIFKNIDRRQRLKD